MKHSIPLFRLLALAASLLVTSLHAQTLKVVAEASSYVVLKDGKVAGPASEIVEASLQNAGLTDHRIGIYPWARAYDMALQEPNVLIYLIARTPARETQFKWAGEFMRLEYHLYKLRERQDIAVRKLEDARRYSIGVMRDDLRQQYLKDQGFERLITSSQNVDNFRKLLSGQVELVPLPESDAQAFCTEAGIPFAKLEKVLTLDALTTGIYMAYSKATPDETVARTKAAFDKLKADGTVGRLMNTRH